MKRDIVRLRAEEFDLLVIGGGINGCAIARDASLRGLKTALIEKDDFACGASGKSTKIIHGGIRYLEQFNLSLVYEALRERGILLRTAPDLVRPLEFIIPVYKGDPRPLIMMRTGVFIYDMLAGKSNIHCHRPLKKDELVLFEPRITAKDLKGGVMYCDAQMDDIRLCLDNAISAYEAGCCVANKVEAEGFIKKAGEVAGAEVKNTLTGEKFSIRAQCVVNATGAWSNRLVWADEPHAPAITRPTKGIHIIYRKLPITRAMLFSARKDKRIFFAIPWRDYTLIGTTDTDFDGSADEVYATSDEVEYLLNEIRRVFPDEQIDKKGIITTYASLRPLMNTQGIAPWKVSREHFIKESGSGLISVVGGKYTTYRRLAEQVVNRVCHSRASGNPETSSPRKRGSIKRCITASVGPSPAASGEGKGDLRSLIEHAVKDEMANSLEDLLIRRLQLANSRSLGLAELEESANIMAGLLGWTPAQKESKIRAYKEEIRKNTACLELKDDKGEVSIQVENGNNMYLDKFLSIIFLIFGISGAYLSARVAMSVSSFDIALEVFKNDGANIAKLFSLVQQKVNTTIGFILLVIAPIGNYFTQTDKFKKIRIFKNKIVGTLIAIFISIIIIGLCLVLASVLNRNIEKETKMNLAQLQLKERFSTEEKVTNREFLDTLNDAKTLFGIEKNKNESKIEFLSRYTSYLGLEFPRNVNLSELTYQ